MRRLAAAWAVACAAAACGGTGQPRLAGADDSLELGLDLALYTAGATESEARARGFAMVVDRRRIALAAGVGDLVFDGVPETLDPGTVWLRSLTDPSGTKVLEQSFEHDAANLDELVRELVGQEVVLVRSDGELRGRLAHVQARAYVLDVGGGQQVTVPIDDALVGVRLPAGPSVSLRPTLSWKLDVARGGEHAVELVYAARRVSWWASYSAVVDVRRADAVRVELSAWATVVNPSRFRFEGARVKLVAGEADAKAAGGGRTAAETTAAAWVWPVEQRVTLEPESTRQLALFAAREALPARIELTYEGMPPALRSGLVTDQYYGNSYQPVVNERLVFEIDEQLPGGLVQVFVRRRDGEEPAWVARAPVEPTRSGDDALLALGQATGVVGSRRQLGFNYDYAKQRINEALEIKLDNQRGEPVRVIVVEDLYRANGGAQVVNASPKPLSMDGKRVTFAVDVPAHGSAKASYEAIYQGVGQNVTP